MTFDLTGKTALVTGASGDIGKAIAKQLHAAGASVIISGRNKAKLDDLASVLGSRCSVKEADLSQAEQVTDLISSIEKLDILVCNAGITKDMLSIKMRDEDFEEVINVNLKSCFALNRESLKKMIRARSGRIINISSVVAFMGNPGQANYCAAKAGLVGMSKSMAKEVASRGVTINVIAPGFIASAMTDKMSEAQKEKIAQHIPMNKLGTPQDVASGALFLASDESAYITGQTLHINGGLLMA